MRHGMWEKVAKRSHRPQQLYSFGASSDDIMLFGTVDYVLKDGKGTTVEWAARAHFSKAEGELKMDYYQVYLVCPSQLLLDAHAHPCLGHCSHVSGEVENIISSRETPSSSSSDLSSAPDIRAASP